MPADNPAVFVASQEIHSWEAGGADSAEALSTWVGARLKAHEAALAALLAVEGERTPENSLRLYDQAIEQLSLAGAQAGILNSVAADKAVRDQAQMEAQRVAQAASALSLNRDVYEALAAIDLGGANPPISAATKHYVERTLLSYRLAGVDKDQATRDRLQSLHNKATQLSLTFSRNIQEGAKTVEATTVDLDGLPADYLARHPANADGRVTLTTDPPDMQPVMTFASSAALRERMFFAYNTRAYPANKTILEQLLATRQEIAGVLGFRSWADLATADQMMVSAANVRAFLAKLNEASLEGAKREHELILDFTRRHRPELTAIDIASRGYWYEQFRRSAFDFDSQSVRPYFPYAQVEAGVLETAAKLFKIEFRRSTAPAWHPGVSVFEVFDGGQNVGRFYLDMHPREGKDKWFSAAPVVTGVRGHALPEAALICNFPCGDGNDPGLPPQRQGPVAGDPGLLQYSDVVTFFHEFGHLMHAILGGQTEWAGISGFATEGDFIEVPSQMLEEFFRDEKLLQTFARHYQTGETLPSDTIEKMKLAGAFGRADWVRSQLYYTTLSLDLHDRNPVDLDLDLTTRQLYQSLQPWTWLEGNRMYASFGHLTGYSSNYYTYAFDKVIALDFFAQFDPANLLGCEAGSRYRKMVLEQGGSKPGRQMVRDFLGRDEEFAAFSKWLNEEFEGELPASSQSR
ncbi:MAG: M3 family metallopeptidase [Terracidiphilus sp.]|jgi:thimet oligopeptidase